MKYIIKNSDLFLNGKLIPEGSELELTQEQINGLEDFLIQTPDNNDSNPDELTKKKLNTKGNKK